MFSLLLSKVGGYLVGAIALIGGIFAAWTVAKRSGVKEQQAQETEKELQQAKGANEINQNVRNLSDADVDKRLRVDQRD